MRPKVYFTPRSELALWARRIAVVSLQLLILAAILHRFAGLSTPAALNVIGTAFMGGAIALGLSALAVLQVWRLGLTGWGNAFFAAFIGAFILATPAAYLPSWLSLPALKDVSTDTADPPPLVSLASIRPQGANDPAFPAEAAAAQQAAYPDIQPLTVERPADETFELALGALERLEWPVVAKTAPDDAHAGLIEAQPQTSLIGVKNDLVVRIASLQLDGKTASRVDVRSSSRYGDHDFGANADRIRTFLDALETKMIEQDQPQEVVAAAPAVAQARRQTRSAAGADRPAKRRAARAQEQGATPRAERNARPVRAEQRKAAQKKYKRRNWGQDARSRQQIFGN